MRILNFTFWFFLGIILALPSHAQSPNACLLNEQNYPAKTRIGYLKCQSNGQWIFTRKLNWGVVFGSDSSFREAKDEIQQAHYYERYQSAKVFLRQGRYRSVVLFDTRDEARTQLRNINRILTSERNDAYIRDMNRWCINRIFDRMENNIELYECRQI